MSKSDKNRNTDKEEIRRAELKALQESEKIFKLITENAADSIFIKDSGRRYTFVNKAMQKIIGLPEEKLLGKTPEEIFGPVQGEIIKEVDDRTFSGETVHETRLLAIGDKEYYFNTLQSPLGIEDGKVTSIMGIVRDTTEHNHTENALRDSEARYRDLVESTSDWVWEVDENAIYTYASPKVQDILGYTPNEVLGKTPFDLMPPEEAKRVADIFAPIIESEQPFHHLVNTNLHKDGDHVVLETSGVPIIDMDGIFRGYRGIDRDITGRRRMEETVMNIATGISSEIGETFFHAIVERLSATLNADYAYIGELLPGKQKRARTLSFIANGKPLDNMEVDIAGTPCETIVGRGICIYVDNVQKRFPDAKVMASLQVEAYAGAPLFDSRGNQFGLMTVMFKKPIENASLIESTLKIFASRVAGELERKRIDDEIQHAYAELDQRVQKRTQELKKLNKALLTEIDERKKIEQEVVEKNTALKVLLEQRVKDQAVMEQNILNNIQSLVLPYLSKLKKSSMTPEAMANVRLIESNLEEIVSPFASKLTSRQLNFSARELEIADLIRSGKQGKEIAELLSLSVDTVNTHRKAIRRKLGLTGKGSNLRSALISLSQY